jgi:hypothetical protein
MTHGFLRGEPVANQPWAAAGVFPSSSKSWRSKLVGL